jgi:molybdopterin converting factor small subunit
MPKMILTGSIRQRAGGSAAVDVDGSTARAAIAALEEVHPKLRGWIVDEQGVLRRHVKLFHRGAAVTLDAPLGPDDQLYVVAAISGG